MTAFKQRSWLNYLVAIAISVAATAAVTLLSSTARAQVLWVLVRGGPDSGDTTRLRRFIIPIRPITVTPIRIITDILTHIRRACISAGRFMVTLVLTGIVTGTDRSAYKSSAEQTRTSPGLNSPRSGRHPRQSLDPAPAYLIKVGIYGLVRIMTKGGVPSMGRIAGETLQS
jgi:hypothetical protein